MPIHILIAARWLSRVAFACAVTVSLSASNPDNAVPPSKPLLRDFMGLCTHTIQFRPELYKPICRLARDYHPLNWDVGDDTSFKTQLPMARNGVDWSKVYGSWKSAGFQTDASVMFDDLPPDKWTNPQRDAHAYGLAFARAFGPTTTGLVQSVEIGNEPGLYPDDRYRAIFENMAKGIRAGDAGLKVATCAMTAGKSGRYAKSLECVKGLEKLYDAINVHSYAEVEGWPTWRRSFPEDPAIPYLRDIRGVVAWRDANAPKKPIWLTEFGWDASSKPAPTTGDFARWAGSTETQQAQYLVRSFLVFSAMDLERAYIYWFNDDDQPQVHGSSGLTRGYKPKPAYWAVAHLFATLGDYRFERAVTQKAGELYVYEFRRGAAPATRVWAVWSPTGANRHAEQIIDLGPEAKVVRAERMPMTEGKAPAEKFETVAAGRIKVTVDESPLFLWENEAAGAGAR